MVDYGDEQVIQRMGDEGNITSPQRTVPLTTQPVPAEDIRTRVFNFLNSETGGDDRNTEIDKRLMGLVGDTWNQDRDFAYKAYLDQGYDTDDAVSRTKEDFSWEFDDVWDEPDFPSDQPLPMQEEKLPLGTQNPLEQQMGRGDFTPKSVESDVISEMLETDKALF
jgi:hypothetical protein